MSRARQMMIAASIFFSVDAGIHYYLYLRIVRDTALPSPVREIATAVIVFLGASIPLSFFLMRALRFDIFRPLSLVPYVWMGPMMWLVFAFVSIDIVRGLLLLAGALGALDILSANPETRLALHRIPAAVAVLGAAILTAASLTRAARKPTVKTLNIHLPRFPRKQNGLKIVQISDLHIGATGSGRRLASLVNQISALHPDVIAITGDLVDGETRFLKREIAAVKTLRAPLGVYFITGNHEYYSGVGAWIAEIKRLGVRVLRNESVPIGEGPDAFYLAGVDDYASKGMAPGHGQDIPRALRDIPEDKAVVLLAHQPKAAKEASAHGVDLVLSGHTHGGQIWPFSYLVALQQPYNKGLYRCSDTTQIYVSHGTFTWGPPLRLGTEGEITEIILSGDG